MSRIGIFGGSFNPVHQGHLALAREAVLELNLDKIYFVPSFQNPLKKKEALLPDVLRVKLLRAAVRGNPDFAVSLCEIQRKGPSFTIDTLKSFKKKLGSDTVLYFLSGADVLKNIQRWKSVDQIFKLCRFVVMTRPGYPMKPAYRTGRQIREQVLNLPFLALSVSSSEVRSRLRRGQKISGLVPRSTESLLKKYFTKHKGV